MTRGERGGNPEVRSKEFVRAMTSWRFEYEILDFPDLRLAYTDLETMVNRVTVAAQGLTTLVSSSPNEITPGFEHPDHNRVGEVTRIVSTEASDKRGLLYWTSHGRATLTDERVAYAEGFYPSQKIPREVLKTIGESYLKIR